ncbi:hypothetical protein D3C71_2200860 [compost metagenome]
MMVCSGVLMGWYGADVTPGIFQENFIEMMVTIDALNGSQIPQVFMCLTTGLKPH